jgi:hypothetical protein
VREHIKEKKPMSELKLDLTWSRMKKTVVQDVKGALLVVAQPDTICSSWRKATLTRCSSEELFVFANKHLVQHTKECERGTPLPTKVDDIMDEEEEFVLCPNAVAEGDQGWRQGIACALPVSQSCQGLCKRVATCSLPCASHAIAHPFRNALRCPESVWMMHGATCTCPRPQAQAPGHEPGTYSISL